MSQIAKVFLGIFLTLIGVLVLAGVISADIDVTNAERYHQNVINEIQCSNLSDSVINECITNTANNTDYELLTEKVVNVDGKTVAVKVTLKYKYAIAFLNVLTAHEKCGYAR